MPLYDDERKFTIERETDCSVCEHLDVCDRIMEKRCENYVFGTSEGEGCQSCINRYTRYDNRNPLPCFLCKSYKRGKDAPLRYFDGKGRGVSVGDIITLSKGDENDYRPYQVVAIDSKRGVAKCKNLYNSTGDSFEVTFGDFEKNAMFHEECENFAQQVISGTRHSTVIMADLVVDKDTGDTILKPTGGKYKRELVWSKGLKRVIIIAIPDTEDPRKVLADEKEAPEEEQSVEG